MRRFPLLWGHSFILFVSLVEPNSQNPKSSKFDTLMQRHGGYVVLGGIAAICALFDVSNNECVTAAGIDTPSKAITSSKNSKIEELKKIKEKELKKKLEKYK